MGTVAQLRFESDLSELTSTVQSNGTIAQAGGAALAGSSGGLSLALAGGATTNLYAIRTFTAISTSDIRIRFYVARNTCTMANNTAHNFLELYENTTGVLRAHLRFLWLNTPKFEIRVTLANDAGSETHGSYAVIGESWPSYFELHIHRADNGSGANNAFAKLYAAGDMVTPISQVTGIDLFDNFGFDEMRIGHMSGVDTTTSGTMYLDEIQITDTAGEIGPHVEPTGPEQVTGLHAEAYSPEKFILTWSEPAGSPTGYKVEVSDNDADWTVHTANTGSTSTEFYPGGYTANTTKYWRVSAINGVGTGTVSSSVSATTSLHAGQEVLALIDFADPFTQTLPPYGAGSWTDEDLQHILGLPVDPLIEIDAAPIANAGPDQAVVIGQMAQLNGAGSFDPNGLPVTYLWSVIDAPIGSVADVSSTTTVNPTFTPDLPGTYTIQLIVSDGVLDSAPDLMVLTTNLFPVANAGPDQLVDVGTLVQLDGSMSTLASSYNWVMVQTPDGSLATLVDATTSAPSFLPDLVGTYIVSLSVTDGVNQSQDDFVTITAQEISVIAPLIVASTRVVTLPGDRRAGVTLGGQIASVWKYPKDIYDVAVDWSGPQVLPAGAVSLGTLVVSAIDPELGSPNDVSDSLILNYTGSPVTGWGTTGLVSWVTIQGGTKGKTYLITFRQTFDNGQVREKYVELVIRRPRKYATNLVSKYPNDKFPVPVQWAGREPRGSMALSTLITKAYDASDVDETSTYVAGSFVAGTIGAGYILGGTGGESRLLEFAQEFSNGRKFHEYALLTVEAPPA